MPISQVQFNRLSLTDELLNGQILVPRTIPATSKTREVLYFQIEPISASNTNQRHNQIKLIIKIAMNVTKQNY